MNKKINNEKSFKDLLSIIVRPAAGFAILIGALALTSSAQVKTATTTSPTTTGSAPVTVVNTTANPVPVAGTVNVGGTANVRISDNSATNPLQVHDVDNAPRTAFAQTKKLTFNGTDETLIVKLVSELLEMSVKTKTK